MPDGVDQHFTVRPGVGHSVGGRQDIARMMPSKCGGDLCGIVR